MRIDGYDDPVDLVCTVAIGEDGIDVDFEGTSPVCGHGINVPLDLHPGLCLLWCALRDWQ